MKIKNLTCGIVGLLVTVSSVKADVWSPTKEQPMNYVMNTETIKAACEKSEKTWWVERNQICIPRNPCADTSGKYEKYCNKDFENVYSSQHGGAIIAGFYADTHSLSCTRFVPNEKDDNHLFAPGFTCVGNDIMQFKIDCGGLRTPTADAGLMGDNNYLKTICEIAGSNLVGDEELFYNNEDGGYGCSNMSENNCRYLNSWFKKFDFPLTTEFVESLSLCKFNITDRYKLR